MFRKVVLREQLVNLLLSGVKRPGHCQLLHPHATNSSHVQVSDVESRGIFQWISFLNFGFIAISVIVASIAIELALLVLLR